MDVILNHEIEITYAKEKEPIKNIIKFEQSMIQPDSKILIKLPFKEELGDMELLLFLGYQYVVLYKAPVVLQTDIVQEFEGDVEIFISTPNIGEYNTLCLIRNGEEAFLKYNSKQGESNVINIQEKISGDIYVTRNYLMDDTGISRTLPGILKIVNKASTKKFVLTKQKKNRSLFVETTLNSEYGKEIMLWSKSKNKIVRIKICDKDKTDYTKPEYETI